jgi:hypothetical protein
MDTFCIIERYGHLLDASLSNRFLSYEAFGANLWSSTMSPALEAVPMDHIVCHVIYHPWVKGAILFKALNRVSIPISLIFRVTHTLKRPFNYPCLLPIATSVATSVLVLCSDDFYDLNDLNFWNVVCTGYQMDLNYWEI